MPLSIIVTHHQTPAILKLCLKTIEKSCQGIKYETILVDSESEAETREIIKDKFPGTIIIPFKKNVGYAKLVNAGIKKAKGRFILILNADILPKKDSVGILLDFLQKNSEVGIVGPQLLNFDGTPQFSTFRYYTPWTIICRRTFLGKTKWGKKEVNRFLLKSKIQHPISNIQNGMEVDWLMGSALMVKMEAIKKVGLLDERFFMYFEDVDWARRFWENGYKVVCFQKAQMYHYHYKSSDKGRGALDLFFNKQARVHLESALKYFWKYRHKKIKIQSSNVKPNPKSK